MQPLEQVVFLHGIGAGPESWDALRDELPDRFVGVAPQISGLRDDDVKFTLTSASENVVKELDRRGIAAAHLCGLSLGAVVALQVALDHPERVASLVLSGGQVHPSRVVMGVQSAIFRLVPARRIESSSGMSKKRMLSIFATISRVDFRDDLAKINAPTLVMCGTRDRPNLLAARMLADGIHGSRLHMVEDGGHQLNIEKPDEFRDTMNAFLTSVVESASE